MMNKIIKILDNLINFIVIFFSIIIFLIGLYAIYDMYYISNNARLSEDIEVLKPTEDDEAFSLATLQEINGDICGWIRINDTNIDYPIVIGKDNAEYLNLDYKKEYSTSGCIFLDYRNDKDFADDYSIIYGHNMKSNLMFGGVKDFLEVDYFNNHQSGTLYTNSGVYTINILSVNRVNAFENKVYNLIEYRNGNNAELVRNFNRTAIVKGNLGDVPTEKLLLLSTCDSQGSNDRIVLLGSLARKAEDNTEFINENSESSLAKLEKEKTKELTESKPRSNIQTEGKKKQKARLEISLRNWALIILTIIVIIIFLILIVKNIKIKMGRKPKKRRESKGKHAM